MKSITKIACLAAMFVATAFTANAQIITVTANGTITGTANFDSTVVLGGAFSATFTINPATAVFDSNTGLYIDNGAGAGGTETFGDYILTQTGSAAKIFTGANYGYDLGTPSTGGAITNDIKLLSTTTPAVAPTGTLADIANFPLSTFDNGSQIILNGGPRNSAPFSFVQATITSYTVTEAVPEPASYALGILAFAAFAAFRLRRLRHS